MVGAALVDYAPGSVVTYNELLVSFLTREGRKLVSTLSHIWVDSPESVAGGRELWAIPKGLARFERDGDSATVDVEGRRAASLDARVGGRLLPGWQSFSLTTAQKLEGRSVLATNAARAHARRRGSTGTSPPTARWPTCAPAARCSASSWTGWASRSGSPAAAGRRWCAPAERAGTAATDDARVHPAERRRRLLRGAALARGPLVAVGLLPPAGGHRDHRRRRGGRVRGRGPALGAGLDARRLAAGGLDEEPPVLRRTRRRRRCRCTPTSRTCAAAT